MVRGGIDDRPYLARIGSDATAVALGGYVDFAASYWREAGLDEGLAFEARRFNLFVASHVADRVRFTSELEFENGTEEIVLETAALDVLFHHALNLRGGVVLVPLGRFNLAHDSPLMDVVDRPLVSTQVIGATQSDIGFGLFGAFYPGGGHRLIYELYALGGLQDGVLAADGTRIAEGRPEAFAGEDNGVPAVSGRLAFASSSGGFVQGGLGYSAYAAIYNTYRIEGERIDDARWLTIMALDGELSAGPVTVRGEGAVAHVELPPAAAPDRASHQWGLYTEVISTLWSGPLGWFDEASLAAVVRVDYVDMAVDTLGATDVALGEETTRLSVGASFRPAVTTPLRCAYLHEWKTDVRNNPFRAGGIQCGLASYF